MKKITLTTFLLIALLLPQQSQAQDSKDVKRVWATAGLGVAEAESESLVAVSANLTYQFGANLVTVRALGAGEFDEYYDDDIDELGDISILYGRSTARDSFHASIAAGLGIVEGIDRDSSINRQDKFATTVGLALQSQLYLNLPILGIGVYGFANINSQQPYYGVTLNLQIGKLH